MIPLGGDWKAGKCQCLPQHFHLDAPLSFFLISAPRGPLSKHWSNDLRPGQLLVACLLTKALKPKTLKKRKKCKYLFSSTLQRHVTSFFILFHKTQEQVETHFQLKRAQYKKAVLFYPLYGTLSERQGLLKEVSQGQIPINCCTDC